MPPPTIRRIVIVGGGTAGWMAAALLSKSLGTRHHSITLVESDEIGTVGVGEATIPMIILFNDILGLNEDDFVRETKATFKLGIQFINWRQVGQSYFHPFGTYGVDMDGIHFTHFWQRFARTGAPTEYGRFNLETMAAAEGRFTRTPQAESNSALPRLNYAFQFDAGLYAAFLRRYAEARGAVRTEGRVVDVSQDAQTGFVTGITLSDGRRVEGDLFLDCSGFGGLLIEKALNSGYEDWSQWLPCDRAVAVPCDRAVMANGQPVPTTPYTQATAQEAGWQWRIPLQHRVGNGYVFSSAHVSEDEATRKLLSRLEGPPQRDPKVLRFTTGHRRSLWSKNVVAIGLSGGFLEPLESTSIHLIQVGLTKLVSYFPRDGFDQHVTDQYNREVLADYTNVKDFLIAHYHVTERSDTSFWQYCKHMSVPDSLAARLEIFRHTGQANVTPVELFREASWFAVLTGQGLFPTSYHPVADTISEEELKSRLSRIRTNIQTRVHSLSSHDAFLARIG